MSIVIYTDGSCKGNPGPGGWAAVFEGGESYSGNELYTTSQRMEVTAAIKALQLTQPNDEVIIYSDSQYLVNTMTKEWKRNANNDLWAELDSLIRRRVVKFVWMRGHEKDSLYQLHAYNQRADKLASDAAEKAKVGMIGVWTC